MNGNYNDEMNEKTYYEKFCFLYLEKWYVYNKPKSWII